MPGSKMIYLNNNYFIITSNHFQGFSKKLTLTRSETLKVPTTEIFLFSYLKLHLIKITSAKKFCDLNQRQFF